MNLLTARIGTRKSKIAGRPDRPINRWASEPMLQSPITNRKSQMGRWPDDPMTRWFHESPLASDGPNLV